MTEIGSIRECFGFGFWKVFVLFVPSKNGKSKTNRPIFV
jgi:hypothetical protein